MRHILCKDAITTRLCGPPVNRFTLPFVRQGPPHDLAALPHRKRPVLHATQFTATDVRNGDSDVLCIRACLLDDCYELILLGAAPVRLSIQTAANRQLCRSRLIRKPAPAAQRCILGMCADIHVARMGKHQRREILLSRWRTYGHRRGDLPGIHAERAVAESG